MLKKKKKKNFLFFNFYRNTYWKFKSKRESLCKSFSESCKSDLKEMITAVNKLNT